MAARVPGQAVSNAAFQAIEQLNLALDAVLDDEFMRRELQDSLMEIQKAPEIQPPVHN